MVTRLAPPRAVPGGGDAVSCASWWADEGWTGAAPFHATRRDVSRATEGHRVALIAKALGTPLLPWQRYTAEVAGELLPDGSYAYPVVVVTVPRQSGKTTLMRAVGVDRGMATPGTGVFYTAQTGKDARERWRDLVDAIGASPLAPMATIRRSAGAERVIWPNGSTFRAFAPLPKSLHGYTPPLVMLDEAFAHDEQTGDDLMGAIGPAQITLRRRQLWIVSTAGTAASVFLRRWVEAGRGGAAGVALLEWAAPPGLDIYDPAGWPTFHPGMVALEDGSQLVTAEALAAEADRLSRAEFERAYGNRWTRTASHHIAADSWDRLADPDQRPPDPGTHDVVFCWDVMPNRDAAALVACWRYGDRIMARLERSGPGMDWLADELDALVALGWRHFAYATDGPAREVGDVFTRAHPDALVTDVGGRDYADAWGFLLQHVARGSLAHDGTDQLATAAANVATRPMLDTAAPSRGASAGDVSPLIALMVASWVVDHRPAPLPQLEYRL